MGLVHVVPVNKTRTSSLWNLRKPCKEHCKETDDLLPAQVNGKHINMACLHPSENATRTDMDWRGYPESTSS